MFSVLGDEENLLQLSAATINAEWLVGSILGQACQGQCPSESCLACRAATSNCSEQKESSEGSNIQKAKVKLMEDHFIYQIARLVAIQSTTYL